jgi:exosortase E/protease (VPEID-CTERM system)
VLIAGFLFRFRDSLRFPRALWLVPLGILAVWLGNAVRISLLMIIGARVDAELAVGSFHSKAGWVFFCGITLGIAVLGKKLPFFAKKDEAEVSASFDNPTAPLLVPILAWIGIGLVTSRFSEGHDPLYVLRVGVVGCARWMSRDAYRRFLERPTNLAWIVGVIVGIIWLLPIPGSPTPEDATSFGEGWAPWAYAGWVVARCVGAVIVIPMCEEFAFRGYLARWLTKREFWEVSFGDLSVVAVVVSSLAFGFLHERFVLATITGVVYALLLRRTRRMIDAVAAHAASNAVIAVWVLATGNFQHW